MHLYTTTEGIARAEGGGLALLDLPFRDLKALLEVDPELQTAASAAVRERWAIGEATLCAPVQRPGKVIGIGINYQSHVEEMGPALEASGQTIPENPVFFIVASSAVTGPGSAIVLPAIAPTQVDYEGELALIIGRGGRNIAREDALKHVAGFTMCNDVSARDVQAASMESREFTIGHAKGFDTFKPLGPCLATRDEFSDPLDVRIRTRVNGEPRQDARTIEFVHDIPAVIAHVSQYTSLEVGDVITTGSPSGVSMTHGGVFLQPGDVVEVEGEGIGVLRNEVQARFD